MLSVTAAPSVPMRFARGCFDKLSMTAIFATFLPFSGFTVLAILRFHLLGRFDYLVDVALVHEGGLRKVVVLALETVSYTHLRAHETVLDLVCRLLLEKKK